MKIRNFTISAVILSGMLISVFGEPVIKYNGLNNIIIAQSDAETETVTAPETQGSTPRIKSKKRAEFSEGKSPLIAAGLSLLVPGAGEFYGRDYIRSGIFFGIEALTLSMWYYYESDGDDRRDEYRDYADLNFDETLYYGGLLGMTQNIKYWLEKKNSTVSGDEFDAALIWNYDYFSGRDNWAFEGNDSLAVSDLLGISFGNNAQSYVGPVVLNMDGGSDQFTHNLPQTKTQQYYEMIGKYHQFACGWNDYTGYEYNEDGSVVMITDSIRSSNGTYVDVLRPKLKGEDDPSTIYNYDGGSDGLYSAAHVDFYENLRDETNQAYEMGSNFLMITLLNHVASAFDASYVIKSKYQIDTQIRIENKDTGDKIGLDNYKITYSVNW